VEIGHVQLAPRSSAGIPTNHLTILRFTHPAAVSNLIQTGLIDLDYNVGLLVFFVVAGKTIFVF